MRRLLALCCLFLLLGSATPARAEGLVLHEPAPGPVVRAFAPGVSKYSAGHRGVDLQVGPGAVIRSAAPGIVHFAGTVAGRPSVSVNHGSGLRTTYTPVQPSVRKGQTVAAGTVLGALVSGGDCSGCLHWGLTDGTDYHDPLDHLAIARVRLLPDGAVPPIVAPLPAAALPPSGNRPVAGPTTSRFGMRTHPVTGAYKLHDGTDIAAPCGTPVRLPDAGRVISARRDGAYGNRVVVDHGNGRRSAYAHLSRMDVSPGQQLDAGMQLGQVGNTGYSTGCHLHWMEWRHGELVDPLSAR